MNNINKWRKKLLQCAVDVEAETVIDKDSNLFNKGETLPTEFIFYAESFDSLIEGEIEPLESQLKELKGESVELRNLVKWLYIQTNGLDSSFDLSPNFVEQLKGYLEPLEYCLKNEVGENGK